MSSAAATWPHAYPDAVIPGYTHLRRAQAVLWPHYLLAYFEMFARDFGAAGAGAGAHQRAAAGFRSAGREWISVRPRGDCATISAFAAITRNSMDVSGDRDFALDFLYCLQHASCCI